MVSQLAWLGVPPKRAAKKPMKMEPYRPGRGPAPVDSIDASNCSLTVAQECMSSALVLDVLRSIKQDSAAVRGPHL